MVLCTFIRAHVLNTIKLLHLWLYLHTHAQQLMYLQLAGRWPIKRLIAVSREKAIKPPSDPGTMVHAGAEWAWPLGCNDGMSLGWLAWQGADLTNAGVISEIDCLETCGSVRSTSTHRHSAQPRSPTSPLLSACSLFDGVQICTQCVCGGCESHWRGYMLTPTPSRCKKDQHVRNVPHNDIAYKPAWGHYIIPSCKQPYLTFLVVITVCIN